MTSTTVATTAVPHTFVLPEIAAVTFVIARRS